MALDLSGAERSLLLQILEDRLGTLREEVYHSTVSTFTDELKKKKQLLTGIIDKVRAEEG